MSRSYKKPSYSDYSRNYTKFAKRLASKKIRRFGGLITNGNWYKKVFNSWNIFDYKGSLFKDSNNYISDEDINKSKRK